MLGQHKPLHSRSQSVTSIETFHNKLLSKTLSQSNQRLMKTKNSFDLDQTGNIYI